MRQPILDLRPSRSCRSGGRNVRRLARWALALLLAPSVALAAAGEDSLAAAVKAGVLQGAPVKVAPFAVGEAFGVQRADGVLWGGGPRYKARFDATGVEFTPALGSAAPRSAPLHLQASSVSRGDTLLWSAPAGAAGAQPVADGNVVSRELQPGLTERWDVGRDGIELSYVLAQAPAGDGELVVRLAATTELPVHAEGDGLRFLSDFGGVALGGVTGVDADGRRAPGSVRAVDGAVELALPADFVATARYPLVLDPVIGPVFSLTNDSLSDVNAPDISYDASFDRYLGAWSVAFSISDSDIRAQSFDANGQPLGGAFWFLEIASTTVALHPAVASLQAYNRWFIAWEQKPGPFSPADIYGCSVSNVFGQSNTLVVANTALDEVHPDVGGHSSEQPAVVSVVWAAGGAIKHRTVFMSFLNPIDLAAVTETLSATDSTEPCISSSGGPTMRFLVVWKKLWPTPAPGDHDLEGALIDVLGHVLDAHSLISTIGPDERTPDVDGDGNQFVITWGRSASINGFYNAVYSRRFLVTGVSFVQTAGPTTIIMDDPPLDNTEPAVTFTGDGWLLAWSRQFSGNDFDIAIVGLDQAQGSIADPFTYADVAGNTAREPRLCSRYDSDHSAGDGAMLAWQTWDYSNGDSQVLAALINPEFGTVVDIGGGSAGGGHVSVSTPAVGNTAFTHTYDGLYPLNAVTLAIGFLPSRLPFCSGELVFDPAHSLFLALSTASNTNLVLTTQIPPNPILVGFTIYEQWIEHDALTSPCGKKIQLSNGLAITFE